MTDSDPNPASPAITFASFQRLIKDMYFEKDQARGIPATFLWLTEEIGELASALRETSPEEEARLSTEAFEARRQNLEQEFADVLAWLTTIANVSGVDLAKAIAAKYGSGCPGCHQYSCQCPDEDKP